MIRRLLNRLLNRLPKRLRRRRTYREEVLANGPIFYWPGGSPISHHPGRGER